MSEEVEELWVDFDCRAMDGGCEIMLIAETTFVTDTSPEVLPYYLGIEAHAIPRRIRYAPFLKKYPVVGAARK